MEHKRIPLFVTKMDEDKGIVEHVIAVMGNVDLGRDVIHPGAFTKTISERGGKIRVLDNHRTDSCLSAVGRPLSLQEISQAQLPLEVKAKYPDATGALMAETQFLMDTPEGAGIFKRIKDKAISEWSFGYDALDTDFSDREIEGKQTNIRNIRTVKLYEYSPVLFGMNPATTTLSAKSAEGTENAEGTESKPAPDVTENTIRIRVRDPKNFESDTFRTITIGDKNDGIQATVGRLKGDEDTTIQSYIFDKEKWDVEKAREWVAEHRKEAELETEEKIAPDESLVQSEEKAGRVLAARNQTRIVNALTTLIEVLEDAGIDIPGFGKEDDESDKSDKTVPDENQATDENSQQDEEPKSEQVGPNDDSPTSEGANDDGLTLELELLKFELELLEV